MNADFRLLPIHPSTHPPIHPSTHYPNTMNRLFSYTKLLAIALFIALMVFANQPFAAAAQVENFPGGNYSRALENSSDYIQDIRESGQRYGKDSNVRGGYWTRRGRSSGGIDNRNNGRNVIRQMRDNVDNADPGRAFDRAKNSARRATDNVGDNVRRAADDARSDVKRAADNVSDSTKRATDRASTNVKRAADNASDDNLIDRAQDKLEDISDNVREKLNLDQPVPDSTRQFLRDTQENFEDTVQPITGKEKGFYQENIERNREAVGE